MLNYLIFITFGFTGGAVSEILTAKYSPLPTVSWRPPVTGRSGIPTGDGAILGAWKFDERKSELHGGEAVLFGSDRNPHDLDPRYHYLHSRYFVTLLNFIDR